MSKNDYFLILSTDLDETQQMQVQEAVKAQGEDWWHQLPYAWVVRGGANNAVQWMDYLRVIVPTAPSALIVFQLPPEGERSWSARGRKVLWSWFDTSYAGTDGKALTKDDTGLI